MDAIHTERSSFYVYSGFHFLLKKKQSLRFLGNVIRPPSQRSLFLIFDGSPPQSRRDQTGGCCCLWSRWRQGPTVPRRLPGEPRARNTLPSNFPRTPSYAGGRLENTQTRCRRSAETLNKPLKMCVHLSACTLEDLGRLLSHAARNEPEERHVHHVRPRQKV